MTNETIGQRIRRARLKRNITQEELAMRIGGSCKNITIEKWELGYATPKAVSVVKVIAALGCDWEEIYRP